jgi:hypothetical protein
MAPDRERSPFCAAQWSTSLISVRGTRTPTNEDFPAAGRPGLLGFTVMGASVFRFELELNFACKNLHGPPLAEQRPEIGRRAGVDVGKPRRGRGTHTQHDLDIGQFRPESESPC